MRIDHLRVQNFKGFEDQEFSFPRSIDAPSDGNGSFHLIIGQNGTGKTSALDALAVAVGGWLAGVPGVEARTIEADDVRVRVLEYEDTARIERQFPVIVTAEGRVMGKPAKWERRITATETIAHSTQAIKDEAEIAVKRAHSGEPVTLPLISYYGTGRLWPEPKAAGRWLLHNPRGRMIVPPLTKVDSDQGSGDNLAENFASRLAGYRSRIDVRPSPRPRDLLRWLKFEQQLAVQEKRESTQFQVVKAAITSALAGCERVEYHLRLGLLLDIRGQPRLPFGALSDGQRTMIAMVGDLAYRAAQLNPHLGREVLQKTPGIVLIDELDLHLHPRWQRHVVEDLRRIFPEVQFIATTHSPFIVQSMREGELLSLDSQPVTDTAKLGVEEIARGLMGVERPEVAARYTEMTEVARKYLETLAVAASAPEEKLPEYEATLAASLIPYADNPAFQAFLEMEKAAALGHRMTPARGA
jgi:predicted ATP-binding protein involved in virulence